MGLLDDVEMEGSVGFDLRRFEEDDGLHHFTLAQAREFAAALIEAADEVEADMAKMRADADGADA